MEKELEQIYNTLNDEQKQYVDAVIASDRSSKLLPLLRQFIHKNINEEELGFACMLGWLFAFNLAVRFLYK